MAGRKNKKQRTKSKPLRNKLSQRRMERIKDRASLLEYNRRRAWMTHQMIDEDLKLITTGGIK